MASLRELIRRKLSPKEWIDFLSEVRELPDRAVAIMTVATLEDALEELLLVRMLFNLSNREKAALFEGEAPLARLSSRTRLAFALGLIGQKTRRDLDRVREIRNAFAHARQAIAFTTPEIAHVCKHFELVELNPYPEPDPCSKQKQLHEMLAEARRTYKPVVAPRERFIYTALFLGQRLVEARTQYMMDEKLLLRPSHWVP